VKQSGAGNGAGARSAEEAMTESWARMEIAVVLESSTRLICLFAQDCGTFFLGVGQRGHRSVEESVKMEPTGW